MDFEFPVYLDYPEYKKKYPDKTMHDWQNYKRPILLEHTKKQLLKYGDELPEEVIKELKDYIKMLENEQKSLPDR